MICQHWLFQLLSNCETSVSLINPRNEADDETTVSFVPMPLVSTSHTGEHGQEKRKWNDIKKGYTHFGNGDIGLAKITPCFQNSKAVVFSKLENGIGAGTTELHIARPYGKTISARFILLYLKTPVFLRTGESKMTGTAGQKRVPKDYFSENPLPLPPLAEQHRIVAKVDELMALCDQLEQQQADHQTTHQTLVETLLNGLVESAKNQAKSELNNQQSTADYFNQLIAEYFDTLFTTEQSIDQLKQTILQLAVMGKLVPQDPNDEPASVLLEKIAEEKIRLIKAGKIKKQKALPEVGEDERLFELPSEWEWVSLQTLLAIVTDGDHQAPPKSDNGIPFLVIGNLNQRKVTFDNCRYVPETYYTELDWSRKPLKGDILYTVTGSYGIPIPVESIEPFCVQRHVAIFKATKSSPINYLSTILEAKYAFEYATEIATGIAQKTVPLTGLRKMPIPLPPLAEQHRIVSKVNQLLTLCDSLKVNLNQAQTTQTQLADAIVKQAVN